MARLRWQTPVAVKEPGKRPVLMHRKIMLRLISIACFAVLVSVTTRDQPDHLARVLAAIALLLVAPLPLEAALDGARRRADPLLLRAFRFLVFLWLFVAVIVVVHVTFRWTGPEIDFHGVGLWALVGLGIAVGVGVGLMLRKGQASRFDRDRPADATRLGRLVFYGWPFAATAIVAGAALYPPEGGWQGIYPLFQLIFLPFLVSLYHHKAGAPRARADNALRLAGYPLLLAALVVA